MIYEDYHAAVGRALRENPSWRRGQAYFNVLHDIDPELADRIRATEIDPFYIDSLIPAFLDSVQVELRKAST